MRRSAAEWGGVAVATVAIAALLVGCGGGGDDGGRGASSTSSAAHGPPKLGASMSKSRYLARANAICKRSWPAILHNTAEYARRQKPGMSEEARVADLIRLSYMAGFDFYIFAKLLAWGPPRDDREEGKAMIEALREATENGLHWMRITSREQLADVFADYNRRASRYGLGQCLVAGPHLPPAGKPEGLPS